MSNSKFKDRPFVPHQPYVPTEPKRSDFALHKKGKATSVYRDVELTGDSDIDLDEYFEDYDDKRPPIPDKRYNENLSLQDIVDLAPPGTRLCDIILNIDMPRYLEYIDVSFTAYERDLEAEEKAYRKALKKYWEKDKIKADEEMKVYEREMIEYEYWKKEKAIEKLKKQLEEAEKEIEVK